MLMFCVYLFVDSTKMSSYSIPERTFIEKAYYKNNKRPVNVSRAFAKVLNVHAVPDRKTITLFIEKFQNTGSMCDNMRHSQPKGNFFHT